MEDIKNCPFCGHKAECVTHYVFGKARGAQCWCPKCGVEQRIYSSRQVAISAWNRRYNYVEQKED